MNIAALLQYREELLAKSTSVDGFLSERNILENVLPELVDCKLIESEEVNYAFLSDLNIGKINAYGLNESGERLQIYLINEDAVRLGAQQKDLIISRKSDYDAKFNLGINLIKKSIKGHLTNELHDSSEITLLNSKLRTSEFLDQIDVIEFILISPTATVETRGNDLGFKKIEFEDTEIDVNYSIGRYSHKKSLTIIKSLVDLNYLYDVQVSKSGAYALKVGFDQYFERDIEVILAADEEYFESYLCVLPATGMAKLYRRESSRLLEKNVRSFLQFRGVNKGMKETIRNNPEKFIAFNNGLTITARDKEIEKSNGKIFLRSLTDFQIVNGGQTTASIFFASKEKLDISRINLMAKINVVKNVTEEELNDLVSDISLYSNSQSKVSRVDLKSRNLELEKIKTLSKSVLPPNGNKWFFEKSRGEFSTMIKLAGGNKQKLERNYPNERRFSKEQLGKYFTSWGQSPYLVKLGGEKVFRYFIEEISGNGEKKKPIVIDRDFYEELIGRIILFRRMEQLHGTGSKAIGQLRSAVVPYSLSILYTIFNQKKSNIEFNFEKIWKEQSIQEQLEIYLHRLMELMNDLIKEYSKSDDYGQYSKNEDLWSEIKESHEIKDWINSKDTISIINLYSREKSKRKNKDVDFVNFEDLNRASEIYSLGKEFFLKLKENAKSILTESELRRIEKVSTNYFSKFGFKQDIPNEDLLIVYNAISRIKIEHPLLLNHSLSTVNQKCLNATNQIVNIYNQCIENSKNIESEFSIHAVMAQAKLYKYSSVILDIGKKLAKNESPVLSRIVLVQDYFNDRELKLDEKELA